MNIDEKFSIYFNILIERTSFCTYVSKNVFFRKMSALITGIDFIQKIWNFANFVLVGKCDRRRRALKYFFSSFTNVIPRTNGGYSRRTLGSRRRPNCPDTNPTFYTKGYFARVEERGKRESISHLPPFQPIYNAFSVFHPLFGLTPAQSWLFWILSPASQLRKLTHPTSALFHLISHICRLHLNKYLSFDTICHIFIICMYKLEMRFYEFDVITSTIR